MHGDRVVPTGWHRVAPVQQMESGRGIRSGRFVYLPEVRGLFVV
jgi:hypothetical protein